MENKHLTIGNLKPEDIEKMSYNEIIALVKETNRPPGGRNSIFELLNRLFINETSKILEIGTSTGFTSLEISRLIRCPITSIDINQESLNEAERRAKEEGFNNIRFIRADICNTPFEDNEFDLVIIGNVLSIISERQKAFKECIRVCKKKGFLAAIPMYYFKEPSEELVKNISDAIKVSIKPYYKSDWINFLNISNLEVFWQRDFRFDYISDEKINSFVEDILQRPHLNGLLQESYEVLKRIYKKYMFLFRENLSKMGFSIFILTNKQVWEDPELYTSTEVVS